MKKRKLCVLYAVIGAVLLSTFAPSYRVKATEYEDTSEGEAGETEPETEHPESYYLPIESDAVEGWPAGPLVEGEAAVVMDADTGAFLYSKNREAKEYPASITKIMTTLVALENGDLDSKVKFSEWAVNSLEEGSSRLWLDAGEWITLRQALYGVMLESANDCANAVAEKIGGSEEGFTDMMNQKAAELGCTNTHFVNAHGLHNENHYTCAADMALITQAALKNKTFVKIMKTIEYHIPKSKHVKEDHYLMNHQKMMFKEGFKYKGCIGGKTGFTEAALNTLVTIAKRKGRTLICVLMRTNGPNKICYETADLLDYGFKNFENVELPTTDGQPTRADLLSVVEMGRHAVMQPPELRSPVMETASTVKVTVPKGADTGILQRTFSKGGGFDYTYNGWQTGRLQVTFPSPVTDIPQWKLINTDLSVPTPSSESSAGNAGAAENTLSELLEKVQKLWDDVWEWMYARDVAAALVILLLIILLLPMLVIAYIRNRASQKIRKQRQKERQERVRVEKDIDSKSVSEIEAELRAELEKDRRMQERKEAERLEEERLERELREMEGIIEASQNKD